MASRSASASIRGVQTGDVGRLQAIQLAAGDAFRYVGMSLAASEVTPGLAARRAAGPGADGDSYARVCMRRDLIADGPPVT
jgi:hypothetical protein